MNKSGRTIPRILSGWETYAHKPDLTNFKNIYGDLKQGGELGCLIGNHDSEEDGNAKILIGVLRIIIGILRSPKEPLCYWD